MTNRYRAGQPADLSLQLHRVQELPIQFAGPEPTHVETASIEDFESGPWSPETPLRARIMDAAADALDWVLDRLWVGAVGLVVVVFLLVWSLK